jgi:hypothetical protein
MHLRSKQYTLPDGETITRSANFYVSAWRETREAFAQQFHLTAGAWFDPDCEFRSTVDRHKSSISGRLMVDVLERLGVKLEWRKRALRNKTRAAAARAWWARRISKAKSLDGEEGRR